MKKTLAALVAVSALALTGCSTSYTFEADPEGGSGDNYTGDPSSIQCFTIEADSSTGDDSDVQLGTFCKTGDAVTPEDDD